jgi:hypothetical protein
MGGRGVTTRADDRGARRWYSLGGHMPQSVPSGTSTTGPGQIFFTATTTSMSA